MAVSVRTENKGTAVVTAEREEISGMSWNSQQSVLQTAYFREKANIYTSVISLGFRVLLRG